MAISLLPAVLLLIISKSITAFHQSDSRHLIEQVREAELKLFRLESILAESISIVDSKNVYIKGTENKVDEMTSEVDHLQSVLLTIKNNSSSPNERLNRLQEEVRLLWATARKNNFELHTLELKAQDAENGLEITKSKVETMNAIVIEQWIQIQHLEQALVITERGVQEVKRQVSRHSFLKFLKRQCEVLLADWWDMLERTWSVVKRNHHQLQQFVQHEMQKWKYSAVFANKEVVFFVASALITFPALSLGLLLLNSFC
uniref:uncharacterized protein LOC122582739 n=1 Tax=Erigeron canadensis TaxID=72917 RepID=UPI001CB96055|nr:uncharacterized protein LOC122582739 [Erigeron canadensis]